MKTRQRGQSYVESWRPGSRARPARRPIERHAVVGPEACARRRLGLGKESGGGRAGGGARGPRVTEPLHAPHASSASRLWPRAYMVPARGGRRSGRSRGGGKVKSKESKLRCVVGGVGGARHAPPRPPPASERRPRPRRRAVLGLAGIDPRGRCALPPRPRAPGGRGRAARTCLWPCRKKQERGGQGAGGGDGEASMCSLGPASARPRGSARGGPCRRNSGRLRQRWAVGGVVWVAREAPRRPAPGWGGARPAPSGCCKREGERPCAALPPGALRAAIARAWAPSREMKSSC